MGFQVSFNLCTRLMMEDIDRIITAALDSGLLKKWCDDITIYGICLDERLGAQIAQGGSLAFQIGDKTKVLTRSMMLDGIKKWLENGGNGSHIFPDGEVDWREVDGISADCIIQYALFGEVID